VQYILGVRPELDGLRIDPCIPSHWPQFEMQRNFRGFDLTLRVQNPHGKNRGVHQLRVDGAVLPGNLLPLSALRQGLVVEVELAG
jgi:cellobiose phosphorylase